MPTDTSERDPEDVRIGATIRALREAHGLKGTELARAIGVSGPLISLIESGDRKATMANCRAIAELLNVPLAAITVKGYEQIADRPARAAS
jgi:transcriptional regulator with XRE-family HTH domain